MHMGIALVLVVVLLMAFGVAAFYAGREWEREHFWGIAQDVSDTYNANWDEYGRGYNVGWDDATYYYNVDVENFEDDTLDVEPDYNGFVDGPIRSMTAQPVAATNVEQPKSAWQSLTDDGWFDFTPEEQEVLREFGY